MSKSKKKKHSVPTSSQTAKFTIPLTESPRRDVPGIRKDILNSFKRKFTAEQIRTCARNNDEKPFGYVIDYIKDMYGLSKIEAWDTAQAVCRFFKV